MNMSLLENLLLCVDACNTCAVACLDEENASKMKNCIKMDLDCAEICQTSINFITRDSLYTKEILQMCFKLCEACALECGIHTGMEHCVKCAERCKQCANECKKHLQN